MTSSSVDSHNATIYCNARIHTLNTRRPFVCAMRIAGHRIERLYAAPPDAPPRGTRIVDLAGAVVVPGLADAHLHLEALGAQARRVDLRGCRSEAEAIERVGAFLASRDLHDDTLVEGFGWDHNNWRPADLPQRRSLDQAFGPRPILLTRVDGHAAWVSSAVLDRAGIDAASSAPVGGHIVRDHGGQATGVLVDRALDLVDHLRPKPGMAQLEIDLRQGAQICGALGLSSVHSMGLSLKGLRALRALERRDELSVRVFVYLDGEDPEVYRFIETHRPAASASLIEVCGVKLYADGALGSRGAALLADYSDATGQRGFLLTEPEILQQRMRRINRAGYQVAVHAIGDRANHLVLALYADLDLPAQARRHRVEHAQILASQDLAAFARQGVVASMQPSHATSDMGWAPRLLGPERLHRAYAWRSLSEAGATLAFGSDAPIESASPLRGLFAAVHRQNHQGQPEGGWRAEQRLSREQALVAYTRGPAQAVHREHELGVLHEGTLADFVVLDQDPLDSGVSLLDIKVLRTVVAGQDSVATQR